MAPSFLAFCNGLLRALALSDGCVLALLGAYHLSLWTYLRQSRGRGLQLRNQVGMSTLPFISCMTLVK